MKRSPCDYFVANMYPYPFFSTRLASSSEKELQLQPRMLACVYHLVQSVSVMPHLQAHLHTASLVHTMRRLTSVSKYSC